MILTESLPPHLVLEKIARHLSPMQDYSQVKHSSPQRWDFAESKWAATAIFNMEPPHKLVGLSLDHPDLSDEEVSTVEISIALLCSLGVNPELCVFLNERSWNEPDGQGWDSGYETLYRLKQDTLRITVRNTYDPAQGASCRQSTALAEVCPKGVIKWKPICQLHGNLMTSRHHQFTEESKQKFINDERELLRLTRTILNV